jgi:two-component system, LuxR family, sensor kinase FixL
MENAALLQALIQNAIDGIITIDERGTVETINPSACRLFGYHEGEVVGGNISMLMPSPYQQQHDGYLKKYHETSEASIIGIGRELTGLRKDGQQFPMQLGVSKVVYSGRIIYAGFIHDLSQQKESEERLQLYASHLEELVEHRTRSLNDTIKALQLAKEKVSQSLQKEKDLSRLKNRFLSMASHEFRTPLSTVQLSASLIDKYASPYHDENIIKHVSKIKSAVANLTAILNDFLYVEQLEGQMVKVNSTSFDIAKLGMEVSEEMQLLAKPNQEIFFKHFGEMTVVQLDQHLIKSCVINLITNAIKYSGENTAIDFHTEISESHYLICVRDNGIGIPLNDQKHLFTAFFRAHNTGSIPGTGLGLNIVARYVALMDGTIAFESTLESGTLFTLTFPIV